MYKTDSARMKIMYDQGVCEDLLLLCSGMKFLLITILLFFMSYFLQILASNTTWDSPLHSEAKVFWWQSIKPQS